MDKEQIKQVFIAGYKKAKLGTKKEKMSPEQRKKIGNYLMLAGILTPGLIFGGRGLHLAHKAKKVMRAGALGSTQEIDKFIADSLARSGKTLPKYEWTNSLKTKIPGAIPVISSRADYINLAGKQGKLFKFLARLQALGGPHYGPGLIGPGHIFTDGYMNPKVLMHELGHAHQPKGFAELWEAKHDNPFKRLKNHKMYREEVRAWNNAGIGEGDPVREAALATYRNAIYGQRASTAASPVVLAGYITRRRAKKDELD